jgi:hypothetical protein
MRVCVCVVLVIIDLNTCAACWPLDGAGGAAAVYTHTRTRVFERGPVCVHLHHGHPGTITRASRARIASSQRESIPGHIHNMQTQYIVYRHGRIGQVDVH